MLLPGSSTGDAAREGRRLKSFSSSSKAVEEGYGFSTGGRTVLISWFPPSSSSSSCPRCLCRCVPPPPCRLRPRSHPHQEEGIIPPLISRGCAPRVPLSPPPLPHRRQPPPLLLLSAVPSATLQIEILLVLLVTPLRCSSSPPGCHGGRSSYSATASGGRV